MEAEQGREAFPVSWFCLLRQIISIRGWSINSKLKSKYHSTINGALAFIPQPDFSENYSQKLTILKFWSQFKIGIHNNYLGKSNHLFEQQIQKNFDKIHMFEQEKQAHPFGGGTGSLIFFYPDGFQSR